MDNFLAGERREMVELYMGRGLREEDATLVIDTLLQYKHVFLDHMMVMELGTHKRVEIGSLYILCTRSVRTPNTRGYDTA
jgi:hypothetical protein